MINYVSENDIIETELLKLMTSNEPCFIGRFGGGDYVFTIDYIRNNRKLHTNPWELDKVKKYNGYYDIKNDRNNICLYLDTLYDAYKSCDMIFGNQIQLSNPQFPPETLTKPNIKTNIYSYGYIESIRPFLKAFSVFGKGKKILIISPFAKSIQIQKNKMDRLINAYVYPECEILTYNTPITYNTNNNSTYNNEKPPDNNWNETLARMKREIVNIDFDIALLSCASYAIGLGHFIKTSMKKKAIYIGGVLNVLFNIYGTRYNTPFFNNIMNLKEQLKAVETPNNINDLQQTNVKSEGWNAYF